jgi:putative proteasome-type protease
MVRRDGPFLSQANIDAHSNLLVGGQIKDEVPRLFHIYGQGNFIEATDDTPYFQLGESKYGKPILDAWSPWRPRRRRPPSACSSPSTRP